MKSDITKIAAIDVGTNSFHMAIASVDKTGLLKTYKKEKEVVRLGSSSGDMKYIQEDAIQRGVTTLQRFAEIAEKEGAQVKAIATSAVREAMNKDEFLDKVKSKAGINIEVVSGLEESRLIYKGALHALPIVSQNILVIDIGGGSTETVVGNDGDIEYANSTKLGAIRMTKRFFPDVKVTDQQIEQCRSYINGEWSPTLKRLIETGFESVVGTSGTIQNLAAMAISRNGVKLPDAMNGLTVNRKDIIDTINDILSKRTAAERAEIKGMDPKRADIILGGALIFERALITLNIRKLVISSYALREGIVFDTVKKQIAIQEHPHLSHLRHETIYNLIEKYEIDLPHAEKVSSVALQIFDDLQSLHGLGYPERELLEVASLLHDIGFFISQDEHHKHSYYILRHFDMPGFTKDEAEVIANIARYHRKSHPKKKHVNYSSLSIEKQYRIKILSSILRVAEGIDRRQLQNIISLKILLDQNQINFHLMCIPGKSADVEVWGADRRRHLMEEAFGKKVNFFCENTDLDS